MNLIGDLSGIPREYVRAWVGSLATLAFMLALALPGERPGVQACFVVLALLFAAERRDVFRHRSQRDEARAAVEAAEPAIRQLREGFEQARRESAVFRYALALTYPAARLGTGNPLPPEQAAAVLAAARSHLAGVGLSEREVRLALAAGGPAGADAVRQIVELGRLPAERC